MAESMQIFQFTLSPVQSFVAQARRTRDFWAGSFLLSWLSGVAIASIKRQGGEVQFPVPDDVYIGYLCGDEKIRETNPPPQQGGIPNRFLATTAKVPHDFDPAAVTLAVKAAWKALADVIWENDLEGIASEETRAIWERQVASFWEVSWVLSDEESASRLLDRRKNWRSFVPSQEPGHKCMMMDGWQELSGSIETNLAKVDATLWKKLLQSGKPGMVSDLRQGERLCAMAFIKRRFARYFHNVKVALPGQGTTPSHVHGWRVPAAVPSVAFLAAAPWLAEVIRSATLEDFEAFHRAAREIAEYNEAAHVGSSAFDIDIACVKEAAQDRQGFNRLWAGLDGQVYFPSALENPRIFGEEKEQQDQARIVLGKLHKLCEKSNKKDLPSPYYAILLMDGDQLGKHMGDKDKQTPISRALNDFTRRVGDIVRQHNGFLIYAGGDDVLALLPLEDALPAAAALQKCYRTLFQQHSPPGKLIDSTLSGAIEYVHFRTPLTRVLQDSHDLLDKVAKEDTGRNAIAVRVWKPSGQAAQWAMPWEKALDSDGNVKVAQLARDFARQSTDEAAFSNKFFFRMQDLLGRFMDTNQENLKKLLLAEYFHSWGGLKSRQKETDAQKLATQLDSLLEQCWKWQRTEAGKEARLDTASPLNPEAALFVRFLAQKGLEKE